MRNAALSIAFLCTISVAMPARAVTINFDDAGPHLTDITTFYSGLGVTFNGIANSFPIGAGPFPAPLTLPATTGGAATWDPGSGTAPGESPPNFAVGLGAGEPGDGGILMSFATEIVSLSLVGLDFGNNPNDVEEMTLTAYDSAGNRIGQQHFTTQFADGAIQGSIALAGMRYVAFNYTNTDFGFYGIDDLSFTPAAVPLPPTPALLGLGLIALGALRSRRSGGGVEVVMPSARQRRADRN